MDTKKIAKKAELKAEKLTDKHESKLMIVEANVELSPEEKIVLYKKLLKSLEAIDKKITLNNNLKSGLSHFSKLIAKDQVTNFITGLLGFSSVLVGTIGLFGSSNELLSMLAGISVVAGSALVFNSALNSELKGDSKIDELETKEMYNYTYKKEAVDKLCEKINALIEKNETLIMGVGM